jgi:hypothetical protein
MAPRRRIQAAGVNWAHWSSHAACLIDAYSGREAPCNMRIPMSPPGGIISLTESKSE